MIREIIVASAFLVATPVYATDCSTIIQSWVDVVRAERYNGKSTVDLKVLILELRDREKRDAFYRLVDLTEMYSSKSDNNIVQLESANCDFWEEVNVQ